MKRSAAMKRLTVLLQLGLYTIAFPRTLRGTVAACGDSKNWAESTGRWSAWRRKPFTSGTKLKLIQDSPPAGTPPGWRAFHFVDPKEVVNGTVCGVVYENNNLIFVFDVPSSGHHANITRQKGARLAESHILVPPDGYVSPELIAGRRSSRALRNEANRR